VGATTSDDRFALLGSLIAAFGLVWVVYDRLLTLSGTVGFVLCWYAVFLGLYWAVSAIAHPRPIVIDRLMGAVICGGALLVFGTVARAIMFTFVKGWPAYTHFNFFTQDMSRTAPNAPLNHGGISMAIVGTLSELGIAILISLPLGVGTAVFISEVGGRFARAVRAVVEAMTALPDILAGLFIYTTLIVYVHVPTSGFAAAMALTVMMIPIIARSAEVVLRVVPGGLREASLALGAPRWRTVVQVVLPTARAGLATALILGVARAAGETAPVYLTSAASSYFTLSPLKPMNSLPLFIYQSFLLPASPNNWSRMWGAASVLLGLVLVLFITARVLARSRTARS
jgi:phosphate transport system permease protein